MNYYSVYARISILIIIISVIATFSSGATRKISKYNFEMGSCPQKCRLNQETQACAEIQSFKGDSSISNICTHFLQSNFNSISDCEKRCQHCNPGRMVSRCTKGALDKRFGICKLKPETGPCKNGLFTMWHYDLNSRDCKIFVYGGCGGNDNKFGSHLECLLRCGLLGFMNDDSKYEIQGHAEL